MTPLSWTSLALVFVLSLLVLDDLGGAPVCRGAWRVVRWAGGWVRDGWRAFVDCLDGEPL